jgi:heat-inducible transcriptional repressor
LHLTKERLRELFHALEEKRRILDLLDQFLAAHADGVQVQVGLGEAHPAMRELTLIGLYLPLPGGVDARLAVLGPLRMNYPRVIRAIRDVGEAFHTALQ